MSAWNNRRAERGGQDRYRAQNIHDPRDHDYPDYEDYPDETPRRRVSRLTRTETAAGRDYRDAEPYVSEEDELEAVADELDRLMVARSTPQRETPSPRKRVKLSRKSPRAEREPAEGGERIDKVISALERLDRQVQDLSDPADAAFHDAGEHVREDYVDPRSDNMDRYEDRRHRTSDRYEPGFDTDDYDDMPERPRSRRARANRGDEGTPARHMYRDLSRRIDSLRRPQEETLEVVRQEIGSLRDQLGSLSKLGRNNGQNAELRRLSEMVERMRTDRTDERFAREVRSEVAELKSLVGRTNVDGSLKTLESGYAHIVQRLDELSRGAIDPRAVRALAKRLSEIEESFTELPKSDHLLVIEDRVADIAERMEDLLLRNSHAEIEPLRQELRDMRELVEKADIGASIETIGDRMKFVAGRLDELETLALEQRGLENRLTAMENRLPEPEAIDRLHGRLEDIVGMIHEDRTSAPGPDRFKRMDGRLDEIMGRLDRMEREPEAAIPGMSAAFSTLEQRLDMITGKIESMEERATKPVPVLTSKQDKGPTVDTQLLNQLQSRISDLNKRLETPKDSVTTGDLDVLRKEIGEMRQAVSTPPSMEALETRISDLADAFSRSGENMDDGRFEQISSKVAALASQLESAQSPTVDMSGVNDTLARIEEGMRATRKEVVNVAAKAARDAVQGENAAPKEVDRTIKGLQTDLRRLLDAAEGSEQRTQDSFKSVQSVLGSLTGRLDKLEEAGPAAPVQARATERKMASAHPAMEQAEADIAAATSLLKRDVIEDHKPSREVPRDRKADFIAAARRAAQAASAEMAEVERQQDFVDDDAETAKPAGKRAGWLRNALSRGRKNREEPEVLGKSSLAGDEPEDDTYDLSAASEVMPDARPAPDEVKPGSGRRRKAILLAAAAVILAIGTLQAFKLVSTFGGNNAGEENLASVQGEVTEPAAPMVIDGTTDGPKTAAELMMERDQAAAIAEDPASSEPVPKAPMDVASQEAVESPVGDVDPASLPKIGAPGDLAETPSTVAFAPPEQTPSSFADGVAGPEGDAMTATAPGAPMALTPEAAPAPAAPADVIANLPPEEVGPMALRSAAAAGNPAAQFVVGVKYTEGTSVGSDLKEAAQWYEKAAVQGLAPAQYRLASLFEKGRGVEKDLEKAKLWYTKAAGAGNAKAMHNLAVLHAEGASGTPNFEEAAKWFEAAAGYGVPDSLFNLGILYARGLGVKKDLISSYKWFGIAANQGDRDAAKKRDDVANLLGPDDLAAARVAVDTFKVKTPEPGANKVPTEPSWGEEASAPTQASMVSAPMVNYEDMVRVAQAKLTTLGFDAGVADGQMGPKTRNAIKNFQRSIGSEETGEVDAALIEALKGQPI